MAKFLDFLDPNLANPSSYGFYAGYDDVDSPLKKERPAVHSRRVLDSSSRESFYKTHHAGLYDSDLVEIPVTSEMPRLKRTFPRTHRHEHCQFPKPRDVFERLTDHRFFTGAHKERFDENGNGRGLAGREYLYIFDGYTQSTSRPHEVYSSVIRRPHKNVVPYGTLGLQKFGVQIATPKLMWLYRNGDKHHDGIAFYVRPFIKNMDILYQHMSKEMCLIAGPVRRIYDQNLRLVTSLDQIVDGAKYLCTSGEPPAPANRLRKFMDEWVVQEFAH
ncbi:doublecortin [Babesia ovis]|uniref:Doublecortin n=1 Tax=Babesia ovis TaxID=5869 RepID=A0A9W5WV91_BABOV|nr:doublecortin [Babesia ovis]